MPRRLILYPYNLGSGSARALATALNTRRVRQNGNYRWFTNHTVINWGNSHIANWMTPRAMGAILNKPSAVASASDKIATFLALMEDGTVAVPDFTTSRDQAREWLASESKFPRKKHAVLCRTLTRANSGRGIVLATTPEEVVPAPLYTRYTPKRDEYRVHVFERFGVIDVQQKRKQNGFENRNEYVRNHDAGWVFCRENVEPPADVLNTAKQAVLALGLDFGAVDIGYHPEIGTFVYEINTAPGLEGQTLTNYAETFQKYL